MHEALRECFDERDVVSEMFDSGFVARRRGPQWSRGTFGSDRRHMVRRMEEIVCDSDSDEQPFGCPVRLTSGRRRRRVAIEELSVPTAGRKARGRNAGRGCQSESCAPVSDESPSETGRSDLWEFEPSDLVTPVSVDAARWSNLHLREPERMRPFQVQTASKMEGRRARSCEPVRVGHYEYPEPLREVSLDPGFNCNVTVRIGGVRFRCCIDTGGARSIVRKEFVQQLLKSDKTREMVGNRAATKEKIVCSGICKGMRSLAIEAVCDIDLVLESVAEDGITPNADVALKVCFAELSEAADALLIGYPEISAWDTHFWQDSDGNDWVEFRKLGVTLLAEKNVAGQMM